MNPIALIQHYNRLNGNSISLEKLKAFHQSVQSCLDSVGHGPYVPDLKGILERATKQIKRIIEEGADGAEKIELVPIDVNKHTGKVLRVASGYEEKKQVVSKEKPDNLVAEEIAINEVHTDTKRFQNRTDAFSEASADSVAKNYDANKFDPIVVWEDPKAKKIFVLSGHSRYEGMKRRNSKTIPVRYFKGNEEEAIKFAKVEANRVANQENLIEDLSAYRLMRDGDDSKGVKKATKTELQKIFKGKVQKLDAYSHLSSGGLFVNALSQSTTSNYPYLERNAQWIGQLRKENAVITHAGEDNIFHYFYSDKSGRNLKQTKDEFFKAAQRKINQLGKGEGVLFPECSSEGCLRTNDKETDPIKGESYKRLREINETLASIKEKLTSHNNKLRVSTEEEKKYLRATGASLEAEKEKIQRDLDIMDKSQASLFGIDSLKDVKEINALKQKRNKLKKSKRTAIQAKIDQLEKAYETKYRNGLFAKKFPEVYALEPVAVNGPQFDAFEVKRVAPTKGPLNRLQRAALEDAIKSGRTPKVNLKAKMNAKVKPAPLFEEPTIDPKQASLFGQKKSMKVKPSEIKKHFAKELKKKVFGQKVSKSLSGVDYSYKEIELGAYKKDFHRMFSDTIALIWGMPGHGKTVYLLKYAQYRAEHDDNVLYVAREEYGRSVFDMKLKEHNINHKNLRFRRELTPEDLKWATVIFLDSVSALKLNHEDIEELSLQYPNKNWVLVLQSTKGGDFRGSQEWEHLVDVAGEISHRKLILRKNRLDPNNSTKAAKLMTDDAIAEARSKQAIRQAVKDSVPKPVTEVAA